jgi:hypothetical protein
MGWCSRIRRFALILCIFLCSSAWTRGVPQTPPAKGAPPATPSAERVQDQRDETPLAVPGNHQKTENYTLSQDRYEKAIAYSRAGYALYFVMSFFDILVMILA